MKTPVNRQHCLESTSRVAARGTGLVMAQQAQAAWPSQSVRVVWPCPLNSSTHMAVRSAAARLSQQFGQRFAVDHHAGAGGHTGMAALARSARDGDTMGIVTTAHPITLNDTALQRKHNTTAHQSPNPSMG